ncbi:MAG: hypothetical protein HYY52_08155 [Candidatus Melainabacteria bacterium]|nr:hypothetical protein [Candidatus Melainabacteria bacterium]
MSIKGKYIGKRKIELFEDLNLPLDTEIFFIIEEIKPVEAITEKRKKKKENPWREIAEMAEPIGRSDLSVKHHEILGDLIE